jgi:hypothetical protein
MGNDMMFGAPNDIEATIPIEREVEKSTRLQMRAFERYAVERLPSVLPVWHRWDIGEK